MLPGFARLELSRLVTEAIDGDRHGPLGRGNLSEHVLRLGAGRNEGQGRRLGDGVATAFADRRTAAQTNGRDAGEESLQPHVQGTSMNVGMTIVVSSPVSLFVMVSVTSSSPRTNSIV